VLLLMPAAGACAGGGLQQPGCDDFDRGIV